MLTFLLHVIPMNLVIGGSLIALINRIKSGGEKNSFPYRTAELISRWLPVLIAATVTFGVAPLLFVQVLYGRLLYTSSILMGWIWLSVIPLLILAYYSAYYLAVKKKQNLSRSRFIAALSSFLFVLIGIIFTANMSLMLRPEKNLNKQ
jgi:hypothetical protein